MFTTIVIVVLAASTAASYITDNTQSDLMVSLLDDVMPASPRTDIQTDTHIG